jgi:hypothetical protein
LLGVTAGKIDTADCLVSRMAADGGASEVETWIENVLAMTS